jgi:hypothetical protein
MLVAPPLLPHPPPHISIGCCSGGRSCLSPELRARARARDIAGECLFRVVPTFAVTTRARVVAKQRPLRRHVERPAKHPGPPPRPNTTGAGPLGTPPVAGANEAAFADSPRTPTTTGEAAPGSTPPAAPGPPREAAAASPLAAGSRAHASTPRSRAPSNPTTGNTTRPAQTGGKRPATQHDRRKQAANDQIRERAQHARPPADGKPTLPVSFPRQPVERLTDFSNPTGCKKSVRIAGNRRFAQAGR